MIIADAAQKKAINLKQKRKMRTIFEKTVKKFTMTLTSIPGVGRINLYIEGIVKVYRKEKPKEF